MILFLLLMQNNHKRLLIGFMEGSKKNGYRVYEKRIGGEGGMCLKLSIRLKESYLCLVSCLFLFSFIPKFLCHTSILQVNNNGGSIFFTF